MTCSDDDDDDGLQLEENPSDVAAEAQEVDDDDDDDLQLEENAHFDDGGDSEDDGLALEENASDSEEEELHLEDNADGLHLEGKLVDAVPITKATPPSAAAAPHTEAGITPNLTGRRVVLHNLASKPELNGKLGWARSYDQTTGRYGVKVDGPGALLALKPGNLSLAAAMGTSVGQGEPAMCDRTKSGRVEREPTEEEVLVHAERHMRALQLREAGRPEEAAGLLQGVLSTARRELGDGHAETLAIMNNMGALLQSLGRLDDAEPFCREVADRRRATLGVTDAGTLTALTNLGTLHLQRGEAAQAVEVRREIVAARTKLAEQQSAGADGLVLAALDGLAIAMCEHSAQLSNDADAAAARAATSGGAADGAADGAEHVRELEAEATRVLEEGMAILTVELRARLKQAGAGCGAALPQETKATLSRMFNVVMKHPELGVELKGYYELMGAIQKTMGNDDA